MNVANRNNPQMPASRKHSLKHKPSASLPDEALMDLVQRQTFRFFWEGTHWTCPELVESHCLLLYFVLELYGAFVAEGRMPTDGIIKAIDMALSRYRMKNARDLRLAYFQATATAARHMFIADARKARCVLAEVRWRWTLKVL